MRYLVAAHVKPGKAPALARAIDQGTLGRGSVAGDEYLDDMEQLDSMTMAPFAGWRSVSARRRWRKNALTGRNTLSY